MGEYEDVKLALRSAISDKKKADMILRRLYADTAQVGPSRIEVDQFATYADATARDTALPSPSEGMVVGMKDSDAGAIYLDSYWRGMMPVVLPSGDATGATDQANIQAVLDDHDQVYLIEGTYYIDDTITLGGSKKTIRGIGPKTAITPTANAFPAIKAQTGGTELIVIADLYIAAGQYGIELEDVDRTLISHVYVANTASHGIYGHTVSNGIRLIACGAKNCGGDGVHVVSTSGDNSGNAMSLQSCELFSNDGSGLEWAGSGLTVSGCLFEGNGSSTSNAGIHLNAADASAQAISITGNYFEGNNAYNILLTANSGFAVGHCSICGNWLNAYSTNPSIKTAGSGGAIRQIEFGRSNCFTGSSPFIDFSSSRATESRIYGDYTSLFADESTGTREYGDVEWKTSRKVITEIFEVDCSAGGSAVEETLISLPRHSLVHEVVAEVTQTFNGDTTKSFEVGYTGSTSRYIATTALDGGAAGDVVDGEWAAMTSSGEGSWASTDLMTGDKDIIATWTNTANATAGKVNVHVTYSYSNLYWAR